MSVDSIKHKRDKRPHIPSKEEEGYEKNNPLVKYVIEATFPKNTIVHRGHDPELFWMNKYGNDDREDLLKVAVRSLYRYEHISPELIFRYFYRLKERQTAQKDFSDVNELFGNALKMDELEKVSEYYKHQDGWINRLIQGDSLLVMTSLLEREGFAGKVQMIYIDPPYGIRYASNWQMKINNPKMIASEADSEITGEPETVKAFRDTWELGIHSYLSYIRDRLIVAKELLAESGSCFLQISDENVHLIRCIMDEVFRSENFISLITFRKKNMPFGAKNLERMSDYIIWYAKNKETMKYKPLFQKKDVQGASRWNWAELPNGKIIKLTFEQWQNHKLLPKGARVFTHASLKPSGFSQNQVFEVEFKGKKYKPPYNGCWTTTPEGMKRLIDADRIVAENENLRYKLYLDDYPVTQLNNLWYDTSGESNKSYVVQTDYKPVQRCMLMSTDPGDLVLDPTCGSGTTAYIAEEFGRRWVTIDTSRIALSIAKIRLMSARFLYYKLCDDNGKDIRQGFYYKKVPHVTLGSLANNEYAEEVTLYDRPEADNRKLRVSGPFTVETLQNFEPVAPESLEADIPDNGELESFEHRIFEQLKSAGIKNGIRNEQAVFTRVERLTSAYLHAEGFYHSADGERKVYFYIGPKFGTVSKQAVNEAIKECRARGDVDWLVILGFSFESSVSNESITTSMGSFEVTRTRMHDDLLQEGLLKRDRKAASFVTIGEPDIALYPIQVKDKQGRFVQVEIKGLDIYDPIKDEVKARNVADIAYWMVDDDYDGSNFVVRQVFFCGGNKDEFKKWQKGLENLAKSKAKRNVEKTLKIEIDDEAFDRVYSHKSHPILVKNDHQKIAVRVISQFGEESTKVLQIK